MRFFGPLEVETVSKYFFYVALANIVIAVGVTAPVLVPEWGLPLALTVWPGTWMMVAYFTFIGVGVLGVLAWALIYSMVPKLLAKERVSRLLSLLHLSLFEVGVLGTTVLMGTFAGYTGGTLAHEGLGQFVVTKTINWTVIPIGIFITLGLVSTLTGVLNVVAYRPKD